jgi:urease subunit gamma/beta
MHLTAHEQARLLVAAAADLARRRLARGSRLGATEAAALIVDEVHEMAWDGLELEEVLQRARTILGPDQVLPGVPQMVRHLQVDALFPSGSVLIDLHAPIGGPPEAPAPSAQRSGRQLNAGRARREVPVTNTTERTVRVTSHVDFADVNPALEHDRDRTRGWRLDIPAGSSLGWGPGETRTVTLVPRRSPDEEVSRARA